MLHLDLQDAAWFSDWNPPIPGDTGPVLLQGLAVLCPI